MLTRDFGRHRAHLAVQLSPARASANAIFKGAMVSQGKDSGSRAAAESLVGKLARFFPDATPVRIPVSVSRGGNGKAESETTVIEYGTPREVLFACRLPLEFADKVRLQNADGSLVTEAWVVAVQYHGGQAAVAARFAQNIANWIIKP